MKTLRIHPLTLIVAATLMGSVALPALAQDVGGRTSLREQRAKRLKELGKDEDSKKAQEEAQPLYPNATRESPEAKAKGQGLKDLQALQALYEKQDSAGVIAKAEQMAGRDSASAYEKSFAYQLAGAAAADMGDQAKAADYFRKAIEANGLDNNSHYQVMYNLAAVQYGEQKYPEALATLDRFLAETKSDSVDHQTLRASILMNMGRNEDAAKVFEGLLAKNPDDKKLLMNTVASYQQADQPEKANVLLEDAYKRGKLDDDKALRALYVNYMNSDRWADAQAVVEKGMASGTLPPSPTLAKDLMVLAQNAYYKGSDSNAIALYRKAAPMADDGEAYLNMAKLLKDQGKLAEAKAAAQQALDKGIKKPEDAKRILSP